MKNKAIRKTWLSKLATICDPDHCEHCQYLGDGDFLCDKHMEIVISDWMPTKSFLTCDKEIGRHG